MSVTRAPSINYELRIVFEPVIKDPGYVYFAVLHRHNNNKIDVSWDIFADSMEQCFLEAKETVRQDKIIMGLE